MNCFLSSRCLPGIFAFLIVGCSDGPSGMRGEIGKLLPQQAAPPRSIPATPSAGPLDTPIGGPQGAAGHADLMARRELNLGAKPVGLAAFDFDGDGLDDALNW